MGFFSKLFGGGDKEQAHAFVSDSPGKGMTLEEAAKIQEELQKVMGGDDISAKVNAAARLMTGKRFEECVAAYRAIADKHPDQRATCESQVGAALYFLGRYEEAIVQYRAAAEHGEDKSMMQDNIREAEEALAKKAKK